MKLATITPNPVHNRPFVDPMTVRVSVSASHPLRDTAIAHGFTVEREYSTVRCGNAVALRAPQGTLYAGRVRRGIEGGMSGAYARSSVVRYVTPDGWWFEAGGGGPSDLDTLREATVKEPSLIRDVMGEMVLA